MSAAAALLRTNPVLRWVHGNLLSSKLNVLLTLLAGYLLWVTVPGFLNWALFQASFAGTTVDPCKVTDANGNLVDGPGACWTFIKVRMPQILFGLWFTQNSDQIWRPVAAFAAMVAIIAVLISTRVPVKLRTRIALVSIVGYPLLAYALLNGAWLGLLEASTSDWGGLTLTLVLAMIGIIASLPLGIAFALARRSSLPAVKGFAVLWIELFRGTPLITILFVASVLLPLFFPSEVELDKVLRAIVAITIFQSAYTAEAVRGGLASIPRSQFEAADSLGLGYWKSTLFITLPQALKVSIPAIVNSFIELFKDTSLVLIIGLLDLLNTLQQASRSLEWKGYDTEGYIFAAMIYFVFCFSMSQYSRRLERRFDTSLANRRAQQE